MRRRKVLARSVRGIVEKLESRTLLSAVLTEGTGTATIQGVVYNDANGNGTFDVGESVSPGVSVSLAQVGATYAPGTVPTVTTDANGAYVFSEIAAGQYKATIVPDPGFTQDAPQVVTFTVSAGELDVYSIGETTVLNGGGSGSGTITGNVFNDFNQDGVQQAGEQSLAGDTVYLDAPGSGVLTATDRQTTTDNNGNYSFSGLGSIQQLNFASNTSGGTFVLDFSDTQSSPPLATTKTAAIPFDPADTGGDNAIATQNAIDAIDPNGGVTVLAAPPTVDTITSASEFGNTVTVVTSGATLYGTGASVTIAGVTPAGYNGTYSVVTGGAGTFTYTDPTPALGMATVLGATATLPANPFQYTVNYDRAGAQSLIATDLTTALTVSPPTTATLTIATTQLGTLVLPAVQELTFGPLTSGGNFALDFSDASAAPVVTTTPTALMSFDPTNSANDNTNAIRNALGSIDPAGGVVVTNGADAYHYFVTYLLDGPQTTMTVDHLTNLITAPSPLTETSLQTGTQPVPPGVYEVRVVPRAGFHQDPPGYTQAIVYSDQTTVANIGENNRTTIRGTVFEDLNGDGIQDGGEGIVAGETVFIDLPLSGTLTKGIYNATTGTWSGGDPYTTTDGNGNYSFAGLSPGFYRLEIQSNSGMIMDTPEYVDVNLAMGEDLVQNLAEGLPATVGGFVFDDKNANGVREAGEPGVPGQTVFLDVNNDGVQESNPIGSDGKPISYAEPSVVSAPDGSYKITSAVPASALSEAYIQPGSAVSQSIQSLTFAPYVTGGTFVLDYSDINVLPQVGAQTAPITFDPTNTANDNLFAIQNAINVLDSAGGVVVTNGSDAFHYTVTYNVTGFQNLISTDPTTALTSGLGPGTYTLRLVVPPGGLPTAPANPSHSYTFTLGSGTQITGENFGYQAPDLSIKMLKFPTKPVVAGTAQTATARITNVGNLTANGMASVSLYALTTSVVFDTTTQVFLDNFSSTTNPGTTVTLPDGATAIFLGNFSSKALRFAPGQSHLFTVKFSYPLQIPLAPYYVYGQVVSNVHDNDVTNDFTAPQGPVQVTPPFIDLSNVFAVQPASSVDPGQPIVLDLAVTNNGNVTTTGEISFRVYVATTPMLEPDDVVAQTTNFEKIRIQPGRTHVFGVVVPNPGAGLGSRSVIVDVDSGDPLGEMNLANNIVIATMPTLFK